MNRKEDWILYPEHIGKPLETKRSAKPLMGGLAHMIVFGLPSMSSRLGLDVLKDMG